jgi:hypothetical protein
VPGVGAPSPPARALLLCAAHGPRDSCNALGVTVHLHAATPRRRPVRALAGRWTSCEGGAAKLRRTRRSSTELRRCCKHPATRLQGHDRQASECGAESTGRRPGPARPCAASLAELIGKRTARRSVRARSDPTAGRCGRCTWPGLQGALLALCRGSCAESRRLGRMWQAWECRKATLWSEASVGRGGRTVAVPGRRSGAG